MHIAAPFSHAEGLQYDVDRGLDGNRIRSGLWQTEEFPFCLGIECRFFGHPVLSLVTASELPSSAKVWNMLQIWILVLCTAFILMFQ